ncbi:MAG TPA: type 1 glutamine amidotransferase family protein [Ktedonobacteraceae bacterium]|nr:type 1 glutamine amidotransferase family protein [Ktedonobacteraceae bacterium]
MIKQTIHLYVFDTLADWEPSFVIAGLNNPDFQAEPGRFQVKTVGETREPVKSIGGLTILPDMTLAELEPAESALLILPGGDWSADRNLAALAKARQFLEAGVPVAAICGATLGLARVGLLNQRRHTSNAPEFLQDQNYQGAALYQHQRAVADENLITAGAASSIEFAYQIFKKLAVYGEPVLEAWYGLYTTGNPSFFYHMIQ